MIVLKIDEKEIEIKLPFDLESRKVNKILQKKYGGKIE